jgi:hypothetical protein
MGSRRHHYHFAHRYFPTLLLTTRAAQRWLPILEAPEGAEFLRSLWNQFGADNLPENERLSADGFAVRATRTSGGALMLLVRFPPPVEVPEAHFALVVADGRTHEILRYVTLEHSMGCTVLGEWLADGTHKNYGEGPPPDEQQFYTASQKLLGALTDPTVAMQTAHALVSSGDAARKAQDTQRMQKAYGEAAWLYAQLHAWYELCGLLSDRWISAQMQNESVALTQAFWLAMHPTVGVSKALEIARALQQAIGPTSTLSGLIAAATFHKAHVHVNNEPNIEALRGQCFQLLLTAAGPEIAADKKRFSAWGEERELLESQKFMSKLYPALMGFGPAHAWVFQPQSVSGILV